MICKCSFAWFCIWITTDFLKCVSFRTQFKQPLLGIELKKGKDKKRKIKSLNNRQISKKPVHIGLKIVFIVGQRKVSTGILVDNFHLAEREFSANKLLLAYIHKKVKDKMNNT